VGIERTGCYSDAFDGFFRVSEVVSSPKSCAEHCSGLQLALFFGSASFLVALRCTLCAKYN